MSHNSNMNLESEKQSYAESRSSNSGSGEHIMCLQHGEYLKLLSANRGHSSSGKMADPKSILQEYAFFRYAEKKPVAS